MLPVDFQGSNLDLNKPEDWTDEQCGSMRAWYGKAPDGTPGFITAWQPSREDLDALNRGEPLYLRTLGEGFPPTAMFTFNEAGEANV